VLVIGGGGREHALAWKLASDGAEVLVAPGNAGTAAFAENLQVAATDVARLVEIATERSVDLTVVGPEAPLVAGIVDAFVDRGLRIFGPTAAAARIEGSKIFCKKILHRGDVPTALFHAFRTVAAARDFVTAREGVPMVVKLDGLAAGKGVFVCRDHEQALEALDAIAETPASGGILIEEKLDGVEVSVMAITDGRTLVTLPAVQDHKAAHDGDEGPNTGGMGAYCPTPFVDDAMLADIEERILVPTLHAMKREKVPFLGVLYAGLMLTPQGPKVLEYNARFGDPECEALLVRMDSSLLELIDAAVDRRLDEVEPPTWRPGAGVAVVMASEGYPGEIMRQGPIRGLEAAAGKEGVQVFHAATKRTDDAIVSAGGRVLAVTAVGDTLGRAKLLAYSAVKEIRWDGAWCRKDISDKGLARERELAAGSSDDPPMVAATEGRRGESP